MSCKKCGMGTDLTTGLGRCFCAPPSVWELGEECPNCQAGTLQADPEGLVCAGECGEFFRQEKILLMEGRATAKSTSLGSIELAYKNGKNTPGALTPSDIKDTYGTPMIAHLIPILRKYKGMVCNEDLRKQVAKDLEEVLKRECRD